MKIFSSAPLREHRPAPEDSPSEFSLEELAPEADTHSASVREKPPTKEEKKKEPLDLLAVFLNQPVPQKQTTLALPKHTAVETSVLQNLTEGLPQNLAHGLVDHAAPKQESLTGTLHIEPENIEAESQEDLGEVQIKDEKSTQEEKPVKVIQKPQVNEKAKLQDESQAPQQESPSVEIPDGNKKIDPEVALVLVQSSDEEKLTEPTPSGHTPEHFSFSAPKEITQAEHLAPSTFVPPEPSLSGSSRVELTVGEGKDQVTLMVSAVENQVRIVAQSGSVEFLHRMQSSAQELQYSLQQHGLNLSHFGSGSQPQKRSGQEREEAQVFEKKSSDSNAPPSKKVRAIA